MTKPLFSFDQPTEGAANAGPNGTTEPAAEPTGGPAPDLVAASAPGAAPGPGTGTDPGTDPRALPGAAPGPSAAAPGAFPGVDAAGAAYDPAIHSASGAKTATGHWRARRGLGTGPRAASPAARSQGSTGALSVNELRGFLASMHGFAAAVTKIPELALSNEDATNIAVPLAEIASMYNIPVTKEMKAYAMLGMACVYVYGTKISAISARLKRERAGRAPRPQGQAPVASPVAAPTGDAFFSAPANPGFVVADPNKPIVQVGEL